MPDIKKFESTRITYSSTKLETTSNENEADKSFTEAQLRAAIIAGDEKKVLSMLEKGADVNLAQEIVRKAIEEVRAGNKSHNPTSLVRMSEFLVAAAEKPLVEGFYSAIRELEKQIEPTGIKTSIGSEDEFYIHGKDAWLFMEQHEKELKEKFPLIEKIYEEAGAVAFDGSPIRLLIPGIRKYEIVLDHKHADGTPSSAEEQARVMTEVRKYIEAKQQEWGIIIDQRARPFPDLQKAIKEGLPYPQTEAEILASLKEQMATRSYEFKDREGSNFWKIKPGGPAHDPQDFKKIMDKFEEHRSKVLAAKSLDELFAKENKVMLSDYVPGSGVDANLSMWKDGKNLFWDEQEASKASPLLMLFATALIKATGKLDGSLLTSLTGCHPNSFDRIGRGHLAASGNASMSIDGSKVPGHFAQRSPLSEEQIRALGANYKGSREPLTEKSIRVERREGEPGGGLGFTSAIAAPVYMFMEMLAAREALRYKGLLPCANGEKTIATNVPTSYTELAKLSQPFDANYESAIKNFAGSKLLQEQFGEFGLHKNYLEYAKTKLSMNIFKTEVASGAIAEKQPQRSML